MLFNSTNFVVFFIGVFLACCAVPLRFRWVLLLVASYTFYMFWKAEYALLIGLSTIIDYLVGLRLGAAEGARKRRCWLLLSLAVNLGTLGIFKYLGFFHGAFNWMAGKGGDPVIQLLLPVGISFYTFQTLSYSIEVYRKNMKPERHLGYFALYVCYFPQLVAGPIERPQSLIPQLRKPRPIQYDNIVLGLRQVLWGFFKKLVIADRVGLTVDTIWANHPDHGALTLVVAALLFGIQIYCDFSGYADIAIGTSRILGIDLMENFRRPFFSQSLQEHWKRWHISLSTWFRDYLYLPLGGNRVSTNRCYANLFIVFLLSGLWHGANITFVLWGAAHGIGLVFLLVTANLRSRLASMLGFSRFPRLTSIAAWLITLAYINLAWIFFRSPTIADALAILKTIFTLQPGPLEMVDRASFVFSLIAIAILLLVELRQEFFGQERFAFFTSARPLVRMGAYTAIVMTIILYGVFDGGQFIYFQF